MGDDDQIDLVYDPQCPVCEFYCQRIDVSESSGKLSRIDARKDSPIMNEITTAGLDIDQGMVVKVGTELYYGSEAIHQLALLSSKKGIVNRMAYWVFRHRRAAHILYPVLAAGRNLLLKILRRSRINNLNVVDNDHF